jgi:glycogen phosphorylase
MSSPAYGNRPSDPPASDALTDLALDLRWSYNHAADQIWERLDPDLWEFTHNPWVVLQTASREKLQSVTTDPAFQKLLLDLQREKKAAEESVGWFQKAHPRSGLSTVAYFSMEFMLSEALPIYSGGLGNVAGDQLKTASNLAVPVTGIGLLYQQGYFRQEIDAQGHQQALYPYNDPGQLPITPLRQQNGEWLRLAIDFPGTKLWIRTWQIQLGRAKLYLLDTNDPANIPAHRGITSELYGGGPELRLKQEMVLGIGGWQLLRALGLQPEVCHLNEGHAAFAVLERARSYMADNKKPFELALTITRAGNLFTTHTPVEAGFDRFSPDLMESYLKNYAERRLSISLQDLLALGRRDRNDSSEPFNMAYLAFRGSGRVNGVSQLHGQVSRQLFQTLFPRWPQAEVPVTYVTNGVHMATWDSAAADLLWETACGKERWREATDECDGVRKVSDSDLWQLRADGRKSLVHYVRKRNIQRLARLGASSEDLAAAAEALDTDSLTLGFARRFATYKRPNLLLRDPQRLLNILTNRQHPVQLVLAGKAHPQDAEGQEMIRQWIEFSDRPEVRARVIFLSDYDLLMAEQLVQGVDLWVNTPRRPWEASGTSGMKVLVNGGLNLSELDGWWAEAYSPEVGWAIGDRREHNNDVAAWDASEAETLYSLLEREIIPEFYKRDNRGIPQGWVARMRESMARLTPLFSTNRVVRQYTEQHYLSAASACKDRAANQGALGTALLNWQSQLAKHWPMVRFGSAALEQKNGQYLFQVQVFLNELDPDAVSAELYAEEKNGAAVLRQPMQRGERLVGSENGFMYTATLPATRPAADFTPRLVPQHTGAFVPLEASFILWHDAPSWR